MNFVFYKMRVTYVQEQKVLASPEIFCSTLHFITLQLKFCNDFIFSTKNRKGQKATEWRWTHLVHSHYASLLMLTIKAATVWPSQLQYDKSCRLYEFV
jgi:hypothetical protein